MVTRSQTYVSIVHMNYTVCSNAIANLQNTLLALLDQLKKDSDKFTVIGLLQILNSSTISTINILQLEI